ncbi:hypothetical protein LTR36_003842 [Oleoguttula mirabilis]|uniref:BTB domain-containing protein n=1 Tax=Oleoguttula mirabilis TaxID=1507867 RepID=A0AAV9JIP3_9PEZI|nr:hypothetical protein LTR36_003842 [Oleoguttula mirabilis]
MSGEMADAYEAIAERLQSDRLIRIIVGTGEDAKVFHVQQVILESVSDYFVKSMKKRASRQRRRIGLKRDFPKRLATEDDELAVRCWVLGDCYDIARFQDEAMLAVMKSFQEISACWPAFETIANAFKDTPPGSKLRRLMVEQLVLMLELRSDVTYASCDDILNGTNFVQELLNARDRYNKGDGREKMLHRLGADAAGDHPVIATWREYMVGEDLSGFTEHIEGFLEEEGLA